MVGNPLIFKKSEAVRDAITDRQKSQISSLYNKWANDLEKKYQEQMYKTTPSSALYSQQIKALQKELKETSIDVFDEVLGITKQNMYLVSRAVVRDATNFVKSLGFPEDGVKRAYSSVPDYAVRNLITGNVYESGWSLSQRIWSANQEVQQKAYEVVAQGVATNTPIYDISKNLADLVRPEARKQWNPKLLYAKKDANGKPLRDSSGKIIYERGKAIYPSKVDYNAQRLARTLTQHTYQQTFQATTRDNPFILKYQWLANGSRVCEICADRDGQEFDKDDLPLDHPNGMCTMLPVVDKDMTDTLADWYASEDGEYPDIDNFAKNFGYEAKPISQQAIDNRMEKLIKKYGHSSSKTHTAWLNKLTNSEKYAVKEFKNSMGLKWDAFYNKYVFQPKSAQVNASVKALDIATIKQKLHKDNLDQFEVYKKMDSIEGEEKDSKLLSNYLYEITQREKITFYEAWNGVLKGEIESPEIDSLLLKYYPTGEARKQLVFNQINNIEDAVRFMSEMEKNNVHLAVERTKELSSNAIEVLHTYTTGAYRDINEYYRYYESGRLDKAKAVYDSVNSEKKKAINDLPTIFDKHRTNQDIIVRRGSSVGDLAGLFMEGDYRSNRNMLDGMPREEAVEYMKQKFTGKDGVYAGCTSTSSLYDAGFEGKVNYMIKIPEGSRGMGIKSVSEYSFEEEFLLSPHTRVMFVDARVSSGHKYSRLEVLLEVIPD